MSEIIENKIILYTSRYGNAAINETYKDETFWITQKTGAELLKTSTDKISLHLKNIYEDEELDKD